MILIMATMLNSCLPISTYNQKYGHVDIREYDPAEFEERMRRKYEEEYLNEVRKKKSDQLKATIEQSGLKHLIETKTFDTYVATDPWQKKAKKMCEDYVDDTQRWLLVSGPSGCGKTHLCTSVVGSLIKRGVPVWYMLYREDTDKLKYMSGSDTEMRNRKMNLYKTAQVLYIDDLFKGGATRADLNVIYELIDYRYRTHGRTIISTELDLKELIDMDLAIASRIIELSRKVPIKHGVDRNYRMKANAMID